MICMKTTQKHSLIRLIALLLLLSGAADAMAHYRIFAVNGNVTIRHGMETKGALPGADVAPADLITIPEGGSIELLDTRDSKTYKVAKAGQYSPSSIIFEARRQSSETTAAVNRNLRIGKGSKVDKSTVYLAKGKVTRALQNYDPHSDTLQIDNKMLGHYVRKMLARTSMSDAGQFPVPVKSERTPEGALTLAVRNNVQFPLYFNVLRINPAEDTVTLAEIGQPVGSYVLLPNQEIMRSQLADIDADSRYVVIMAHYYFEVDQLLDAINEDAGSETTIAELPVYLYSF